MYICENNEKIVRDDKDLSIVLVINLFFFLNSTFLFLVSDGILFCSFL